MTAAKKSSSFLHPALPAALSALLALALYAVTIGGTYIYDDVPIIRDDNRIHDPRLWPQIWTRDYFNGGPDNLYRPLVSQSYALQWWITGNRPWAFHLVNVLLAAGVCAMVAELGRRLAGWRVGLIAGLLFAAHPVHGEVVAEIVGRADLSCTAGILGALILFLHRPMTIPRALAISGMTIIAMLSKEQGMLMPFLLLALAPVRRALERRDYDARLSPLPGTPGRGGVRGQRLPNELCENNSAFSPSPCTQGEGGVGVNPLDYAMPPAPSDAPDRQPMQWLAVLLMFLVAGFIVIREQVLKLGFAWDRQFLDWTIQPMIHSAGFDRWLIPIMLIGRYARLLVFPSHLSIDYGVTVIGPTLEGNISYLFLGFIAIAAWTIAAILCWRRRNRVGLFCLLAMAITYSMVSNVIIIGAVFNERLIYLPSAFFLIFIAMGIARIPGKAEVHLLIIILCLGCIRTFSYVSQWNDANRFYEISLKEQPRSILLYSLVIESQRVRGHLEEARQNAADALALCPQYSRLWEQAGLVEEDAKNWNLALDDMEHARKILMTVDLENKLVELRRKMAATRAAE